MRRFFALFSLLLWNVSALAAEPLTVTRITPDGQDVTAGRQIVVSFNRPVVPLGRMERRQEELPITITPAVDCAWRWLNTTSLSCYLSEETQLQKSTAYQVVIAPGIAAEDGATLAKEYRHSFVTKRADVRYSWFKTWKAPGHPVIRLTFDQPVTAHSVRQSLTLKPEGGKTVSLKLSPDPHDREEPVVLPVPTRQGGLMFLMTSSVKQKSDDQPSKVKGQEARRVWMAEPDQELPLDTSVTMRLEPGLVSARGDQPSVASRDVVLFDTYPGFSVVGIRCHANDHSEILIKTGEQPDGRLCNPVAPVAIAFSVPVLRSEVKKNFIFKPALGGAKAQDDVWGDMAYERSRLNRPHVKGKTYDVRLPYGLKAAQGYTVSLPQVKRGFFASIAHWFKSLFSDLPDTVLPDEFARLLMKPVKLHFETDHRKPNFVINHHEAVLEAQSDSEVPLYVNNLTETSFNFRRVTARKADETVVHKREVPVVQDVQFAVPIDVRDALEGQSGALYGHLATTPPVEGKAANERRLFAQVTPWQLHVKLGHFSTLVWVTDMATGAPVSGAKVTVYKDALTTLSAPADILARAETDAGGVATLAGTDVIDPALQLKQGWSDSAPKIFVRIDKDDDMALMPLNYDFSINTWRVSNENIYATNKKKYGHIRTWGTTAQGIYRAGDTVQYKFYVRQQNDRTFISAPRSGYKLEIIDPMDNTVETIDDLSLNRFGAYSGDFKVASTAPVGWYKFKLTAKFAPRENHEYDHNGIFYPLRVLVSDFTPAPFRVENSLNGDLFMPGQTVEVYSAAKMHAGGPYTAADTRVTALLKARGFSSSHPVAEKFYFATQGQGHQKKQVFQKTEPLNNKGVLVNSFTIDDASIFYGRLTVESAVQDDRGKYTATQSQAEYVGRDRFVGLRGLSWVYNAKEEAAIEYIVVDARGNPAPGTAVQLDIERQVTNAVKVKGAGNAYLTHFTTEWEAAGACNGVSEAVALKCHFTPEQAGTYRAVATIKDTKDRDHRTSMNMWVVGQDYVLWNNGSDVLLPIIPEKKEYKVGDKARYLIKNPYPGAMALITVERYGIIESFTQVLEGSTPVLELDIKPDYLPGFYLSVLVSAPRAAEAPLKDGQIDLGKPAFKMGYVTVPVRDPYKELVVTAKTDQDVYRPRDKVTVHLAAAPRVKDKAEPIELAVAVLDESVFDLVAGGTANFDPYQGFYSLKGLDVRNYNLLTRLVGRQNFEKKGANAGGDGGGALSMRDLFKFVAYWNPALKTNKAGQAKITFDLPDNLTGWRVLVLGVTPSDRMGLGQGTFKVNRPTEVRPVMPNQVTEKDHFQAGFSVMNRTDQPRDLTVTIRATGDLAPGVARDYTEVVSLPPYKRQTVFMPVTAATIAESRDVAKGAVSFQVEAKDALDGDGMVHRLPVYKMRSLETAANYGTTVDASVRENISFPDHIYPDTGSVSVAVAPSVIGAVEGAFKYMKDYPYLCWEQILTKGVMASHYQNLKQYMPATFSWEDSEGLPQQILDSASSFQAPNGGMTYFVARDEYVDPYLSAYTALAFNWLRSAGYKVPETVESKLQGYLQHLLKNNLAPTFYSEGMKSTVRAVALAALAEQGKITQADLERYATHIPQMSLFGKTHFMQAAMKTAGGEALAKEVANLILSHAGQSGGKFSFNEDLDDSYRRILATPLRENCAILTGFTDYAQQKSGADLIGDVPFKMVRMITQTRQNRDHWENTQENMFCMNALVDYSRVYEKTPPKMTVEAKMDGTAFGQAKFSDLRDQSVTMTRPITAQDVGRQAVVEMTRQGTGRLYYATRLRYAPKIDFAKPVNAGMTLQREYSVERDGVWTLLKSKAEVKRGDILRVDLYLSLPTARNFVVVNDPVPGGLEPVNRQLATASVVDADKGAFQAADGSWFFKFSDWRGYNVSRWSFYHQELRHDRAVFYADYLPAGRYHLSYTAQAIAEGGFMAAPPLAEEMYDPDIYGKGVAGSLDVLAQ